MSGWVPVVLGLQPIDPGLGHATAFSFGTGKVMFKTYSLASATTGPAADNRGGRVALNSVSVPIDGFPANYLHRLPWWGVA